MNRYIFTESRPTVAEIIGKVACTLMIIVSLVVGLLAYFDILVK